MRVVPAECMNTPYLVHANQHRLKITRLLNTSHVYLLKEVDYLQPISAANHALCYVRFMLSFKQGSLIL